MSDLNQGQQPCNNYTAGEDDVSVLNAGPIPHQCPNCFDGLRYFCTNCTRDHHENGWETCKPSTTETEA